MAPEMMEKSVTIGPAVDIYSFGVVMWEIWAERKPWSELSDKSDIFKTVRDEKGKLPSVHADAPNGYDTLLRRCCEYESKRRPLIDSVQNDLQHLLVEAARFHHGGEEEEKKEEENEESDTTTIDVEMAVITKNSLARN